MNYLSHNIVGRRFHFQIHPNLLSGKPRVPSGKFSFQPYHKLRMSIAFWPMEAATQIHPPSLFGASFDGMDQKRARSCRTPHL